MSSRVARSFSSQELIVAAMRTPAGALIARPWFDRVALSVLANWFFPLSRLWAAAGAAEGSVERYFAEIGIAGEARLARRIMRRLAWFERARAERDDSTARWEEAFFGARDGADDDLAQIENQRVIDSNDYNLQRRSFVGLGLAGRVAPIRWEIPGPGEVAGIYGDLAKDVRQAFAAPDPMPKIATSRAFTSNGSRDYWLRFASPAPRMSGDVVARVHEPLGVSNPPTLIFGHGICVEFDHWRGLVDEVAALVGMGVRVVRPEAPWHGRRVPQGQYAGERFMATAPLGALDLFTSAATEWSVLIDWCRQTTAGPVAIGGSSLGAMTAQLIATNSNAWPKALQPDAMLLITHCGHIHDAVVEGALAKVWGIEQATEEKGWSDASISQYLPLIDPTGRPAIAVQNIVSVLGSCDDVTPFHSAEELIESWQIPAQNTFISRHGHFSIPLNMMRKHASLLRFREILTALS